MDEYKEYEPINESDSADIPADITTDAYVEQDEVVVKPQQEPPKPPVYPQYTNPSYTPPTQPARQAQPMYQAPPYQGNYQYNRQNAPQYTNNGYNIQSQPVPPAVQYQQPQQNNPYLNPAPVQQYQAPQPNVQPPYVDYTKKKTSAKTIVFISIMCFLLVAFLGGFIYSVTSFFSNKEANDVKTPFNIFATEHDDEDYYDSFEDFYDGFYNYNPFGNQVSGETFDVEITLAEDKGETQKKSEDKPENSASPDKNAKEIKLEKLPKDNNKYNTQSAYNAVTDSVVFIALYDGDITDNQNDIISSGTGTIISEDGYIVTNSHVIADCKAYSINVVLSSAKEYRAKVVGYDTRTDLALIKIDAKGLKPVTFGDSSLVNVGEDIIVIGNPGGNSFQNSLTRGIVSAVDRELPIVKSVEFIQTDAAINPGNSGGPMCNIYGQVIGINSAKISLSDYEGMGFAIESEDVVDIINDLMKYGYVKGRVRLGFSGQEVDSTAQQYGLPSGIIVYDIDSSGPFANKGIQQNDIITEVDDKEVSTFQDVYAILSEFDPGDKVTVKVYRRK